MFLSFPKVPRERERAPFHAQQEGNQAIFLLTINFGVVDLGNCQPSILPIFYNLRQPPPEFTTQQKIQKQVQRATVQMY